MSCFNKEGEVSALSSAFGFALLQLCGCFSLHRGEMERSQQGLGLKVVLQISLEKLEL